MILYEYPCNEKIRSFLRLEYLFKRLFVFEPLRGAEYEHSLLAVLFEIMDVCERGDNRSSLLQEIDKQKETLNAYRNYPDVDTEVLDQVLRDLNHVSLALHEANKIGHEARDSEWLNKLKNRYVIPGGTSPVEFPAYKAWQMGSEENRRKQIAYWIGSFLPLYNGLKEMLQLVRASQGSEYVTAPANGVFEKALGGQMYQMIRVWLPKDKQIYPEISANKHVVFIRLFKLTDTLDSQLVNESISFKLSFCKF